MKKVTINQNKCIGCGTCIMIAPGTFKLGKNGKSEVISQSAGKIEDIKSAIESCPVRAISLDKS